LLNFSNKEQEAATAIGSGRSAIRCPMFVRQAFRIIRAAIASADPASACRRCRSAEVSKRMDRSSTWSGRHCGQEERSRLHETRATAEIEQFAQQPASSFSVAGEGTFRSPDARGAAAVCIILLTRKWTMLGFFELCPVSQHPRRHSQQHSISAEGMALIRQGAK
jgi:hypothetical protein